MHELKIAGGAQSKLLYHADPLASAPMDGNSCGLIDYQDVLILEESRRLETRLPDTRR
jgi:hypothetical protein